MKLKQCSECLRECYLWQSSPKLCKDCALKKSVASLVTRRVFKEYESVHKGLVFKEEKRDDSLRSKKKSGRRAIKQMSAKKLLELKEYRRVRDRYLRENPVCEFPGCSSRDVQLHHKKGRVGGLLCDERYFCSLCDKHHRYIEENPILAKELGLSLSRLDKD